MAASEGGFWWSHNQINSLISVWGDDPIQEQLKSDPKRNIHVFKRISDRLQTEHGVHKTPEACRAKIKKLKFLYRKTKVLGKSSHSVRTQGRLRCEHFEQLDRILGSRPYSVSPICLLKTEPDADKGIPYSQSAIPDTVKLGKQLNEGKTKIVYEITSQPGKVLLQSKDKITAGNAARQHEMKGKAIVSTATAAKVFELLAIAGVKSHFIKQHSDTAFIAEACDMIPIEWVTRRVATGSFLKRNPGVTEGYRFCPPKLEMFYKDDAAGDPQWSREQILESKMTHGGLLIGPDEVDMMSKVTVCVFEILEKAWATLDCSLIDMKIEFGVNNKGEIVLADIIDSDSWRLWPSGDKRLMKDKQVYRDMAEVTEEGLALVKRNFEWVAERLDHLTPKPNCRAVVFMGSPSDFAFSQKIAETCQKYGLPCEMRVSSAHKGTDETLNILAQYEGENIPTVFIAVAGRSNGLGPVLSGNASWPVINCPPIKADWGNEDVWSSLRLPSGLGCSTVISPEAAGLMAAQIMSLHDHLIWSRLRANKLNTWLGLKKVDKKCRTEQTVE
ncbi:multifunctional protein ADE2 isoform X1 [Lingula anatina]|uniref:Multifunctional protein ADE2 isoform X1 n=1 Tax=Lingula anatina TaxID=7574 RepID=A0A1S3JIE0_LINAN|nr:multifunctional protein ADE2 isoform X1 [Lingula anatina]|eukprot:XP_013410133.1 multifunctional protein ADE2 isoform X1 [Lingula anatina]